MKEYCDDSTDFNEKQLKKAKGSTTNSEKFSDVKDTYDGKQSG